MPVGPIRSDFSWLQIRCIRWQFDRSTGEPPAATGIVSSTTGLSGCHRPSGIFPRVLSTGRPHGGQAQTSSSASTWATTWRRRHPFARRGFDLEFPIADHSPGNEKTPDGPGSQSMSGHAGTSGCYITRIGSSNAIRSPHRRVARVLWLGNKLKFFPAHHQSPVGNSGTRPVRAASANSGLHSRNLTGTDTDTRAGSGTGCMHARE